MLLGGRGDIGQRAQASVFRWTSPGSSARHGDYSEQPYTVSLKLANTVSLQLCHTHKGLTE